MRRSTLTEQFLAEIYGPHPVKTPGESRPGEVAGRFKPPNLASAGAAPKKRGRIRKWGGRAAKVYVGYKVAKGGARVAGKVASNVQRAREAEQQYQQALANIHGR